MEVSEIKEEVIYFADLKVKKEKSSSVVYDVEVPYKVKIKTNEEDSPQSQSTLSTSKKIESAIDITVKPDRDPPSDELELESKSKNISDGESEIDSEDDSNKEHPQQIPQSSQASSKRSNRNVSKKKKGTLKIQNKSQLLQCTLCPESFSRVGLLITHARNEHAATRNMSSDHISDDEDETSSPCPLCSKSFASVKRLSDHFRRFHIKNKPFQCFVCLESKNEIKTFTDETFLNRHIRMAHDPRRNKFQCKLCSHKCRTPSDYKRHKNTHIKKQYKCEYCSKTYRDQEGMLKHIIAVHKEYTDRHETFKCDECEQLFCSKKKLNEHVLQTHEEDTVKCKICFKKFTDEGKLSKHLDVSHWENRTWLKCDVCSKVSRNNQELVQHLEVQHKRFFKCRKSFRSFVSKEDYESHSTVLLDKKGRNTKKSQLQCKICLVFLNTECSFTTHKETHLNPREIERKITLDPANPEDLIIKCDFCPKTFVQKSLLLDHATNFHPNQKWECKSCEKSFQVKFQLNKHELLHSTRKLLECQVCHKGFANLKSLKLHEGIHQIDKKYKCSRCEKSFANIGHLTIHVASYHGGDKPFKCDICKTAFVYKSLLVSHSRVHTDERPFSCSKCSCSFKTARHLRNHQQGVHSEKIPTNYKKRVSHAVRLGPHLKYFENLVYICFHVDCGFETKKGKEVAIHYAEHKLPKVVLSRMFDGPAGEVFLSKSPAMNKRTIQARYKCAQCFSVFSSPTGLRNHTRKFHIEKKTKGKKRMRKVSSSDEDEM